MSRKGPVGPYSKNKVICFDTRPCFANFGGLCNILSESYRQDGACPFCKEKITDIAVRGNDDCKAVLKQSAPSSQTV